MAKLLPTRLPTANTELSVELYNRLVRILELNLGEFDPTNTDQFSTLPEQYHEALIAKVMEKLYRKNVEGIQVSQYWKTVYQDLLISAKKYANSRRVDTGFNVIQHDM